jgi:ATP-dependent phosphofructokinase / diphosphate-dependent phosphofructokinase
VLGHIQRGGSPTAFDRVLGTRFGVKAVEMAAGGQFGMMASLRGNTIEAVPLKDAVGKLKTVDMDFYKIAELFFG